MKIKLKLLMLIFILALVLRLVHIEKIPACINWDEAAFLFNAKSIALTARDEYGKFLPLQFTSIGDYKFPGFIYMLVPFYYLFGDGAFTVRIVPALFGALSVIPTYGITYELFKKRQVALLSALFVAISPWHLQFTRAGADIGASTLFITTGIYFLLRSKTKYDYLLSSLFFGVSVYTYFVDRLFAPIIILAILLSYFPKHKKQFKKAIWGPISFLIILLPAIFLIFNSGQQEKLAKTSILGYQRSSEYEQELMQWESAPWAFDFYHNASLDKALTVADHYLAHFSPRFLFIDGAYYDPRQMNFNMGLLYIFQLPFIIFGLVSIKKENGLARNFLLAWLLLAPLPAAITRDPFHARRAFTMLYPLAILTALGFYYLLTSIKKWSLKRFLFVLVSAGILVFSVFYYLTSYYIYTPKRVMKGPAGFNCGYRELYDFIQPIKDNYEKVVIDTSYQGPYLYFLLYEDYPPSEYQKEAVLVQENKDSLGEGAGFANYEFRPIYWPAERHTKNYLFAGPPEKMPLGDIEDDSRLLQRLHFINGEESWRVVEVR